MCPLCQKLSNASNKGIILKPVQSIKFTIIIDMLKVSKINSVRIFISPVIEGLQTLNEDHIHLLKRIR